MRLHLVDGTYELFRAHFAKRPPFVARGGWEAKATVGVVASLLGLLRDPREAVTHLAVAFDNPIRSFRNDLYPGYKTEAGVPPELLAQFDAVEEAVRSLGVAVWSMREHEADDGLATGARRFRDQVEQVRILTPDKDLGQCIREARVVQVDRRTGRELDEGGLRALRGVGPESIPDWLALVGDAADGYPGLPGFGEVAAASLLGRYRHLEDIPAHAYAWEVRPRGALRLATTLAERRDEALLYRRLATLVDDVPLPGTLADLGIDGADAACARLRPWSEAVGATAYLRI